MLEFDENLIGKEFVHFKGGHYRLVGYAKDSETLEPMCVYEALYGDGGLWVRPAKMFFEDVEKPGYSGPRFKVDDAWEVLNEKDAESLLRSEV